MRRIIGSNVTPDAILYDTLIHACCAGGDVPLAERWLETLSNAPGLNVSEASYAPIISYYAKQGGQQVRAVHFHELLIKNVGSSSLRMYNAVLSS